MPVWIALLRAVNVGGHQSLKMAELTEMCREIGLKNPKTYLQSGNVVFESPQADAAKVEAKLQKAMLARFGFTPGIIIRTVEEMREVVARSPFAGREGLHPGKLVVYFLKLAPDAAAQAALARLAGSTDEFYLQGRELHVYFPNGQGQPTLKWPQVERALAQQGTARNWNTVNNLCSVQAG